MPASGDPLDVQGRPTPPASPVLPDPPAPLGRYVPLARVGDLVFLSGMVPVERGAPRFVGEIGSTLTLDEARAAARLAARNALAVLRAGLGDLGRVSRVVRLGVLLRTTPAFTAHPQVADAASELLADVFGDHPGHTRLVQGVTSLPGGMCVELELIVAIEPRERLGPT